MEKIYIEFDIPFELIKSKDKIIGEIKDSLSDHIHSIVERHKRWYERDLKILNCNHKWKTSYERTSMYDSEDVTKCKICDVEIETYESMLKQK